MPEGTPYHLTVLASAVLAPDVSPLNLMTAVKAVADTAEAAVAGVSDATFAPIATGCPGTELHTGHRAVSGEYRIAFSAADGNTPRALAARLDEGLKALRGSASDLGFAWLATRRTEVLG